VGAAYHIEGDITPPELLTKVRPDPDPPCKGHRVQGVAIFDMTIDESGTVSGVHTLRRPLLDPPCPEFEESYRAALSKWKYNPATRDGKPVAVYPPFLCIFTSRR